MRIDEKIAQLERTKKTLKEEAHSKEFENEGLSQEYVDSCIEKGLLQADGREFKFTKRNCLGANNVKLPMLEDYFEAIADTEQNFILKHENDGISIMLNIVPGENVGEDNFKKGMEQNFKDMGLYIDWLEKGKINEIKYFTFNTPTGLGNVYNLLFFSNLTGRILIGNMNCPYTDAELWGKIFKGIVKYINI